ncbi:phage tail protein, partial [Butyricicoccus sp. 1XD8-22]
KNFGISADEAYNIIAVGAQNGADKNGDLLDTLNEYSVQYASLGLSADEFIASLVAGAESGAFSIDKVGDAVKEFNIRAKDGSKSSMEAFTALGLNAEEMTKQFAQGGETANAAFFNVIQKLQEIEDPLLKNTIGVQLFGTQFEDLEASILPVLGGIKDSTI